jgi:hypothetical protein
MKANGAPLSAMRNLSLAASTLLLMSSILCAENAFAGQSGVVAAPHNGQAGHLLLAQAQIGAAGEHGTPKAEEASPQQEVVTVPDQYRLNMMIRSTILALNQANLTGNYTVLKDMGAPGFQFANNASRLSQIFAPMRLRKLDLNPILFYNPQLINEPVVQGGKILRLTGFFATKPEQVNFDLAFQAFAGHWMLAGIAVTTTEASAANLGKSSVLPAPPAAAAAKAGSGEATETASTGNGVKPVRIDLGQPAPMPARRPPHKAQPRSASAGAEPAKTAPAHAAGTPQAGEAGEKEAAQQQSGGWRPR